MARGGYVRRVGAGIYSFLPLGVRVLGKIERIVAFQSSFIALVRQMVVRALELEELPADEDADQLTFELNGIILAANTNFALHQDPGTLDLARQVVRRRLGVTTGSTE